MIPHCPKYNCANFHTFVKKVNDSPNFWLLASPLQGSITNSCYEKQDTNKILQLAILATQFLRPCDLDYHNLNIHTKIPSKGRGRTAGLEVNTSPKQASTLTQNDTGPVGPVTPSIYWSCKMFTGPIFFL